MADDSGSKATLILNPYANRWRVLRRRPEIERELRAAGVEYTLHVTERVGHAIELAKACAEEGCPLVIAAGGDGTIGEVLNGLCGVEGGVTRLGLIPVGSGNDLATMLGVPLNLRRACRLLAEGAARPLDVGVVAWANGGERRTYCFGNNSGLGLEAAVAIENTRLMRLTGKLRYLVAALKGIAKARPWRVVAEWATGRYAGLGVLLSVGNSRRTAGSFYLNPHARTDDGQLDFIIGDVRSRFRLLQLLPLALKGWHLTQPEILSARTPRLAVRFDPPTAVQCDGEIMAQSAREIEYSVLPGRVQVVAP